MSIEMNELFVELTAEESYAVQGGEFTFFNLPFFSPLNPNAIKDEASLAAARGNAANYSSFAVLNDLAVGNGVTRTGVSMTGAGLGFVPMSAGSSARPDLPNVNSFQIFFDE